MFIPFLLYFQIYALPQFQATRAVSGRSVPIIAWVTFGAGAIIRFFGPESMGGVGDFDAKIDAEIAFTGLSVDDIIPKVYISYHATRRTNWSCIQRYYTIQKGNSSGFLAFQQCMITNFSRRRYGLFELTERILNEVVNIRSAFYTMSLEKVIRKVKIFSVITILFKYHQLLPGMWRVNCDYVLRLRTFVVGRNEAMVLRHEEGSACSGTSSALWLRHQNAQRWRRDKQWHRDVPRRNGSTAWKKIGISCEILPFLLRSITNIKIFRFPLAL